MKRHRVEQLAVAFLFFGVLKVSAAVFYVDINCASPTPPYTNWTAAATNIQDAIDQANAGDLVVVTNGTYSTGGRAVYGSATNRVVVDKAITVQSVNGAAATSIAGSYNPAVARFVRCVYLTNGASLIGFTLLNGSSRFGGSITNEQSGGGVWCESSSAIVSNCTILGGYANQFGGGAYQGTLNNCVISNNQAFISGGGTYLANLNNCIISSNNLVQGSGGGGTAFGVLSNCLIVRNFAPGSGGGSYFSTLNNCVVSNNTAGFGGGVCFGVINNSLISSNSTRSTGVYGGGAYSNVLNNCVLKNNWASQSGGGAYGSILTGCVVSNNVAPNGGGAYSGTMTNCLVVGNLATQGGGVYTLNNDHLYNCTIVSNTATSFRGGVYEGVIRNCIVYYNNAPGSPNGSPLDVINCCMTPLQTGPGNFANSPLFANPAIGDYHLQTNSPCINAGNNSYAPIGADLDGNPRISGGTVDVGAFEFQNPASVISYVWLQQYGFATDGTADYADTDHDGMNNWQEWVAGTVPTNNASVLKMLAAVSTNSPLGLRVSWQSVNNRTYFLQRGTNLPPAFLSIRSNIVGQAGTTSIVDTNAIGVGPYFYRVGVQ